MTNRSLPIALALLLTTAAAGAPAPATQPAPQSFECRWTEDPITIDGKPDDKAWQQAQVIDQFHMGWAKGSPKPKTATKARLLWDREYLYFLAGMEDADLFADVTERNGKTWENDVFELFFKPADDKGGYYEFQVNAANTQFAMFIPSRSRDAYEKFKDKTPFEVKSAVTLRGTLNKRQDRDEGWTVEGRLRWRDFVPTGGRPQADERWKFTLCRYDYVLDQKPELSAVAPLTKVDFHRYEDYATLQFVGPKGKDAGATGEQPRPKWTKSRVVGFPDPPPPYRVKPAFPKLTIKQPIYLAEEPGTDNLLLVQHLQHWAGPGKVSRVRNDPAADSTETLLETHHLIYGLTFHPDFEKNGYVYFISNGPDHAENKFNRITRYTIDRQPPHRLDRKSELVILEWESNGHNGGDLAFGPDGYLYHAAGDGTSDSDTNLRGQEMSHLTSKLIRIDVDRPAPGKNYSVPQDNPFVGREGIAPETWAYGFRNPWRLAFDAKTGHLWVGSNGQDMWESVYVAKRGENYGWSVYEGGHPFQPNRKLGPTAVVFPVIDHHHSEARSLTGGVVYYGEKYADLNGAYVYGDFSTGRIWGAKYDGRKITWHRELARTTLQITAFRADKHGDLFVLDDGGGVFKFEPNTSDPSVTTKFPTKLSETGLFSSVKGHVPEPSLIPYSVNSPLWSDGAGKERFIALPGDTKIDYTDTRGWGFPEGAVLVKTFSLDLQAGDPQSRRRVETRLLTKTQGQWYGYAYEWNDEQTDATLVTAGGADKDFTIRDASIPGGVRMQTWHYPSRAECMVCHTRAANFVLGPSTLQMNMEHEYPGGVRENQLRMLEQLGVMNVDHIGHARDAIRKELVRQGKSGKEADELANERVAAKDQRQAKPSTLLNVPPQRMPALVDPYDAHADLDKRARSYLHANCAICHVEAGGGNSAVDFEFTTPPQKMKAIDVPPQHDTFGLGDARIIAPGDPARSVLLQRVARRGTGQMPPLATFVPDAEAVKLLQAWVANVKAPPPEKEPKEKAAKAEEEKPYVPVKVADGLKFPEGPAYDGKGHVDVSNCNADFVTRFDTATGKASVLYRASPEGFQKTNGMTYRRDGSLIVCDFGRKAVLEIKPGGKVEVYADQCDGVPLKGPNDLAFDPAGNLYFTDPAGSDEKKPIGCVYRVDAGRERKVTKVAEGLAFPNGIAFSADAKHLYVAESKTFSILRYPVKEDGSLGEKSVFCRLPSDHEPDGINFDSAGNLWVTQYGSGAVRQLSPEGKVIREVKLPGKNPTNVEFAGKDLRTLFVTEVETGALYAMRVEVAGLPLFGGPAQKGD